MEEVAKPALNGEPETAVHVDSSPMYSVLPVQLAAPEQSQSSMVCKFCELHGSKVPVIAVPSIQAMVPVAILAAAAVSELVIHHLLVPSPAPSYAFATRFDAPSKVAVLHVRLSVPVWSEAVLVLKVLPVKTSAAMASPDASIRVPTRPKR